MRLGAVAGLLLAAMLAGCAGLPTGTPAGVADAPAAAAAAAVPPPEADAADAGAAAPPAAEAAVAGPLPVAEAPAEPPAPPRVEPLAIPEVPPPPGSLWERLRPRWGIADLDGPRVQRWERWYASRPDYVERMVQRGSRYLFHVVEEVERRGLPAELALLPFIESAFNPEALSHARAAGLWQFMPDTGRAFELRQNLFRDDRRAVTASTAAALDYLESLHRRFGDWHLALAAYNWGQGNVSRAIERNRRARKPTDYTSLRMPTETRDYVPKLQAVKNLVHDPARHGLVLPEVLDHPFFASVPIDRDIDVELAAELAGVELADFRALNPQHTKPVILAAGTPEVLLPWEQAERFRAALAVASPPLASWTAWVAPRTMTPAEAARATGMSEAELREVNRIPPRMRIQAGSALLVPRPEAHDEDVDARLARYARLDLTPETPRGMKRVRVRVGPKGTSVAWIARHYGVSRAQVARWNGVSTRAHFKPGSTVIVMKAVPARKARPAAKPRRARPEARAAERSRSAGAGRAASARPSRP